MSFCCRTHRTVSAASAMSIIPIPSIDADAAPALAIAVPAQIPSTEAVTAVEGNSTRKQQRMTSVAAGVNACSSALGGGGEGVS